MIKKGVGSRLLTYQKGLVAKIYAAPYAPSLWRSGLDVLNRRVGRLSLFNKPADYVGLEKILAEVHDRTGIRFGLKSTLRPFDRPKGILSLKKWIRL